MGLNALSEDRASYTFNHTDKEAFVTKGKQNLMIRPLVPLKTKIKVEINGP